MMKTKLKTILSFGYWFGALSLGLLLHPYLTLRKMVRDRLMRPLAFLPLVSAVCLWVSGVMVVSLGGVILRILGVVMPGMVIIGLGFLFWWVMWFLILWQMVLGYLLIRFLVVLK